LNNLQQLQSEISALENQLQYMTPADPNYNAIIANINKKIETLNRYQNSMGNGQMNPTYGQPTNGFNQNAMYNQNTMYPGQSIPTPGGMPQTGFNRDQTGYPGQTYPGNTQSYNQMGQGGFNNTNAFQRMPTVDPRYNTPTTVNPGGRRYPNNNTQPVQPTTTYGQPTNGFTPPNTTSSNSVNQMNAVPPTPPTPPVPVKQTPVEGSEYPIFLADGLKTVKKDLGKYFEYEVVGNETSSDMYTQDIVLLNLADDKTIDPPELVKFDMYGLMRYFCCVQGTNNAIYHTEKHQSIVTKADIEPDVFIKAFKATNKLQDYVILFKQYSNSTIVKILNRQLLTMVNKYLKYTPTNIYLEKFNDVNELITETIPAINNTKQRQAIIKTIAKIEDMLQGMNIIFEKDDKCIVWDIEHGITILCTDNRYYAADLERNCKSGARTVTPSSHEELYLMISDMMKVQDELDHDCETELAVADSDGSIIKYSIYKTMSNNFIITK